jgi:hypothetical protein
MNDNLNSLNRRKIMQERVNTLEKFLEMFDQTVISETARDITAISETVRDILEKCFGTLSEETFPYYRDYLRYMVGYWQKLDAVEKWIATNRKDALHEYLNTTTDKVHSKFLDVVADGYPTRNLVQMFTLAKGLHESKTEKNTLVMFSSAHANKKDILQIVKTGKAIRNTFPFLSDADVQTLVSLHSQYVTGTEVQFARTETEILKVYLDSHHKCHSCMTHPLSAYDTDIHPVRVYGMGGSDISVAYILGRHDGELVPIARAICNEKTKVFGRVYSVDGSRAFHSAMERLGFSQGSLDGSKVPLLWADDAETKIVMPYLDEPTPYVDIDYRNGVCIFRESGEVFCNGVEGYQLIHSFDERCCDCEAGINTELHNHIETRGGDYICSSCAEDYRQVRTEHHYTYIHYSESCVCTDDGEVFIDPDAAEYNDYVEVDGVWYHQSYCTYVLDRYGDDIWIHDDDLEHTVETDDGKIFIDESAAKNQGYIFVDKYDTFYDEDDLVETEDGDFVTHDDALWVTNSHGNICCYDTDDFSADELFIHLDSGRVYFEDDIEEGSKYMTLEIFTKVFCERLMQNVSFIYFGDYIMSRPELRKYSAFTPCDQESFNEVLSQYTLLTHIRANVHKVLIEDMFKRRADLRQELQEVSL